MKISDSQIITNCLYIPHILGYKSHSLYSKIDTKIECDLYMSETKGRYILHNLGENKIILFLNLNNENMNNKNVLGVVFRSQTQS
jgi:hypothetical protein